MPLLHLGPAGDAFAGVFGGVAAVLLLGGPVLLRWQRNRQEFVLAQSAVTRGVSHCPKRQPFWLRSLRLGVMTLTVGVSLLLVGGAAHWMTRNSAIPVLSGSPQQIPMLPVTVWTSASTVPVERIERAEPAGPARFGPPQPHPELEQWQRLQSINSLGLMAMASGVVLTLLGAARIAFARTERRHEPVEELI